MSSSAVITPAKIGKASKRNAKPPKVGFVSLGCPKALVDSEQIITQLRAEGYEIAPNYAGADLVVVNTCGFIDSAVEESLDAIGEALAENGKVIVTGCLGAKAGEGGGNLIKQIHPKVLAVTGPHAKDEVMQHVHAHLPQPHDPFIDLVPAAGIKLTPKHYAYLKISEGCNHRCTFCIIPSMRGDLVSRPVGSVMQEAENLVKSGVKELLVISQDTSAYGVDVKYRVGFWNGRPLKTRMTELCEALGSIGGDQKPWVRLHYVYPYPHVRDLIPLMADGLVLPYLDIPFQHAHPDVLRRMARPVSAAKTLDEIATWRSVCPDITLRSTFIVGYPGETEAEFQTLLDWMDEAQLDRVGCFKYENVKGARSNDLPDHVAEEVKQERWDRFMEKAQAISEVKLAAKVGRVLEVIVDEVDADGATCRTKADAPEIDGNLFIDEGFEALTPGDMVSVTVEEAGDYDLWGRVV